MRINRRSFLKTAGWLVGGALVGGGAVYGLTRDADPLAEHREATEKVLAQQYGSSPAKSLLASIGVTYTTLAARAPYIGGDANMFSAWLNYGVYYLAVHQVLQSNGVSLQASGRLIYEIFQAQAAYPPVLMRAVGRLTYGAGYVRRLKAAVAKTQERRFAGDWVATWVEGDGEAFDFGLDMAECGICKFYAQEGAAALTPYLCLSDEVGSAAMGRGLVRHTTLAEGGDVCDFRFKWGRETYVAPLKDGWPPTFASG